MWYGWGLVRRKMLKITSGDVMTHALVRPSRRSLAFYYGELHPLAYSSLRECKSVVFFHFQSCFHCEIRTIVFSLVLATLVKTRL